MAERLPIDGVQIDLLHPYDTGDVVETRENPLKVHKKFNGDLESCDVTVPHGDKIALRVRFEEGFNFLKEEDIKITIGIGDGDIVGSWATVQAWIVSRMTVEAQREFIFDCFNYWAANGDDEGPTAFRAPDLIEPGVDIYAKCKEKRLDWQVLLLPSQGSIFVFVQRGNFVSPDALAQNDLGLFHRDAPASTDPPRAEHETAHQSRIRAVESEQLMEPMIIRWEWFRPPSKVDIRSQIVVEFCNRLGNGPSLEELESEGLHPQTGGARRRKRSKIKSKSKPTSQRSTEASPSDETRTQAGSNGQSSRRTSLPQRFREQQQLNHERNDQMSETRQRFGEETEAEPSRGDTTLDEAEYDERAVPAIKSETLSDSVMDASESMSAAGRNSTPQSRTVIEISDDDNQVVVVKRESTEQRSCVRGRSKTASTGGEPGASDRQRKKLRLQLQDVQAQREEVALKQQLLDLGEEV